MKKIDRQNKLLEIVNIVEGMKKRITEKMHSEKISPVKLHTLLIVKNNKNISQKSLGNILDISPPAVTQIIDDLENEKLIRRIHDKDDKRKILLKLSKNGQDKLDRYWNKIRDKIAKMIDAFDDKEMIILEKMYKKIAKNIDKKGE